MSEKLKPCPFCGSNGEMVERYSKDYGTDVYYVRCIICNCMSDDYFSEAEAIEAWNRREERTVKPKKGAYDLIRCDCGMPVSSNYDYCPKCKAKLDWSDDE